MQLKMEKFEKNIWPLKAINDLKNFRKEFEAEKKIDLEAFLHNLQKNLNDQRTACMDNYGRHSVKTGDKILSKLFYQLKLLIDETEIDIPSNIIYHVISSMIDINILNKGPDTSNKFTVEKGISFVEEHFKEEIMLDTLLHCKTLLTPKHRKIEEFIPTIRKVILQCKKTKNIPIFLKVMLLLKLIKVSHNYTKNRELKNLYKELNSNLVVPTNFPKWAKEHLDLSQSDSINIIIKHVKSPVIYEILYSSEKNSVVAQPTENGEKSNKHHHNTTVNGISNKIQNSTSTVNKITSPVNLFKNKISNLKIKEKKKPISSFNTIITELPDQERNIFKDYYTNMNDQMTHSEGKILSKREVKLPTVSGENKSEYKGLNATDTEWIVKPIRKKYLSEEKEYSNTKDSGWVVQSISTLSNEYVNKSKKSKNKGKIIEKEKIKENNDNGGKINKKRKCVDENEEHNKKGKNIEQKLPESTTDQVLIEKQNENRSNKNNRKEKQENNGKKSNNPLSISPQIEKEEIKNLNCREKKKRKRKNHDKNELETSNKVTTVQLTSTSTMDIRKKHKSVNHTKTDAENENINKALISKELNGKLTNTIHTLPSKHFNNRITDSSSADVEESSKKRKKYRQRKRKSKNEKQFSEETDKKNQNETFAITNTVTIDKNKNAAAKHEKIESEFLKEDLAAAKHKKKESKSSKEHLDMCTKSLSSDSELEILEDSIVFVKTENTVNNESSDDSDSEIDCALGTEGDIIPCDDNNKMFNNKEIEEYHESLMKGVRKKRDEKVNQIMEKLSEKRSKFLDNINKEEPDKKKSKDNLNTKGSSNASDFIDCLYTKTQLTTTQDSDILVMEEEDYGDDRDSDLEIVMETIRRDTMKYDTTFGEKLIKQETPSDEESTEYSSNYHGNQKNRPTLNRPGKDSDTQDTSSYVSKPAFENTDQDTSSHIIKPVFENTDQSGIQNGKEKYVETSLTTSESKQDCLEINRLNFIAVNINSKDSDQLPNAKLQCEVKSPKSVKLTDGITHIKNLNTEKNNNLSLNHEAFSIPKVSDNLCKSNVSETERYEESSNSSKEVNKENASLDSNEETESISFGNCSVNDPVSSPESLNLNLSSLVSSPSRICDKITFNSDLTANFQQNGQPSSIRKNLSFESDVESETGGNINIFATENELNSSNKYVSEFARQSTVQDLPENEHDSSISKCVEIVTKKHSHDISPTKTPKRSERIKSQRDAFSGSSNRSTRSTSKTPLTPLKVSQAALSNEVMISPGVSDEENVENTPSHLSTEGDHKAYLPLIMEECDIAKGNEEEEQVIEESDILSTHTEESETNPITPKQRNRKSLDKADIGKLSPKIGSNHKKKLNSSIASNNSMLETSLNNSPKTYNRRILNSSISSDDFPAKATSNKVSKKALNASHDRRSTDAVSDGNSSSKLPLTRRKSSIACNESSDRFNMNDTSPSINSKRRKNLSISSNDSFSKLNESTEQTDTGNVSLKKDSVRKRPSNASLNTTQKSSVSNNVSPSETDVDDSKESTPCRKSASISFNDILNKSDVETSPKRVTRKSLEASKKSVEKIESNLSLSKLTPTRPKNSSSDECDSDGSFFKSVSSTRRKKSIKSDKTELDESPSIINLTRNSRRSTNKCSDEGDSDGLTINDVSTPTLRKSLLNKSDSAEHEETASKIPTPKISSDKKSDEIDLDEFSPSKFSNSIKNSPLSTNAKANNTFVSPILNSLNKSISRLDEKQLTPETSSEISKIEESISVSKTSEEGTEKASSDVCDASFPDDEISLASDESRDIVVSPSLMPSKYNLRRVSRALPQVNVAASPRRSRRASLSSVKSDLDAPSTSALESPARRQKNSLAGNLTPVRRSRRISGLAQELPKL